MTRQTTLTKMLEVLIEEWGKEEVLNAVSRISYEKPPNSLSLENRKHASRKTSALSQAKQFADASKQWEYIADLALRYDHKRFLPSVPDVKNFLLMNGEQSFAFKDRSAAFKVVLNFLRRLSAEDLQKLAASPAFSGPARLGPISDAISAASNRLPRRNSIGDVEASENTEGASFPADKE